MDPLRVVRLLVALALVAWLPLPVRAASPAQEGSSPPVGYSRVQAAGVWVHVVTVDLASPDVEIRPLLAPEGGARRFATLVADAQPVAAITGTFFDPPTATVLGNLVEDGHLVREGWMGSALRIDHDGRGSLLPMKGDAGRFFDWSDTHFAVSSGPTLLEGGRIALNPWAEGFTDPGVFRAARRSALGLTKRNKMLMVSVATPITLGRLARVMLALGADRAINLDGGTSSALYFGGSHIVRPGRMLTNAVGVFVRRRERGTQAAQPARALAHYEKGLALLPTDPLRARAQFLRAVSLDPREARAWSALGSAQERLGMRADAITSLVRASALYLEEGKPLSAAELARRATTRAPKRGDAWLALARADLRLDRPSTAKAALKKVLALHPGHPEATRLLKAATRPAR